MILLHEILDVNLLREHIKNGYVTERTHNTLPLSIFNYTPKAQYEWVWDEVTMQCRGLIVSHAGVVISRPFKKFFNWDQGVGAETWQNPMPPPGPAIRMEKMDGSLGILYDIGRLERRDGEFFERYRIATRGSFHSEQAEWATKFMREARITHPELWHERQPRDEYGNPHPDFDSWNGIPPWIKGPATDFYAERNKTYLFEIIYPENRIVVDYGEYKGLVLIDVIDNKTGESDLQEFDDCAWPDKVTRTVLFKGFDSGHAADIPKGDEGFVYLWPSRNFRTKMKSSEYIELHRLVSRLSEKTVWEMLVAGKTPDQIKDGLPDEFHDFVDKTADAILESAGNKLLEVFQEFNSLKDKFPGYSRATDVPRKDIAKEIVKSENKKYLFAVLDNKPIYPIALREAKPVTDRALISTEDI